MHRLPPRGVPRDPRWFLVLMAMAGLAAASTGCSRCAPGKEAHLTAASREDSACKREVLAALQAIKQHLGMPRPITTAHVNAVMEHDTVTLEYGRDGVQYKMQVAVRKDDGACKLMVIKREKRAPGKTETSWGNYGAVKLKSCRCE